MTYIVPILYRHSRVLFGKKVVVGGSSGAVSLSSGTSEAGESGNVILNTGSSTSSNTVGSGNIQVNTGAANTQQSGSVSLVGGTAFGRIECNLIRIPSRIISDCLLPR